MAKRVELFSLVAKFRYSDGSEKELNIDVDANEAFFWSEKAVLEILSPYYSEKRVLSLAEQEDFLQDNGFNVEAIDASVVERMWNSGVEDKDDADLPIAIQKSRRSIPSVACKKCHIY